MRKNLVGLFAKVMGVHIKIDGIPYGAADRGDWETYPK